MDITSAVTAAIPLAEFIASSHPSMSNTLSITHSTADGGAPSTISISCAGIRPTHLSVSLSEEGQVVSDNATHLLDDTDTMCDYRL